MDAPRADLDEEQHMEAPEGGAVDTGEVCREDALGLGANELGPGRSGPLRGRVDPGRSQDRPDGGRGDPVTELCELAVDAPVTPCRVLPREADCEVADLRECWWSAAPGRGWVGAVAGDEPAVPADHGLGLQISMI
jgi:hypothetical protein